MFVLNIQNMAIIEVTMYFKGP